jgi:CHAT domain-containing protein
VNAAGRLAWGIAAVALSAGIAVVGTSDRMPALPPLTVDEARATLAEIELAHGPEAPETIDALERLSIALRIAAPSLHAAEGMESARRVVALREAQHGPRSEEVAEALDLLAMWHWDLGLYEAERPLVVRALAIRRDNGFRSERGIARDLHMLSDISRVEGDFGEALALREQARPFIEKTHTAMSDQMALHYHYLAVIQASIGEREAALENAQRAVAIRERVLTPMDPALARSLNLVGERLVDVGDTARAEPVLERALSIWEQSKASLDIALALENLGRLHAARRDWSRAADQLNRVVQIRLAAFGPDHPLVARSLADLGAVQRRRGDFAGARESLGRALAVQDGSRRASYPDWASTLRELALLDGSEGRLDAALAGALETQRLTREYFRASSVGLSEREALAQARARAGGAGLAWTWAVRMVSDDTLEDRQAAELLDETIRSRALVLDTLASRRRILALHQDPVTAARVATLARSQGRLTRLLMEAADHPSDWERTGVLSEAQADADRAERRLAARSREYRQERERGQPGLAEVRGSLPRRTALVSYIRFVTADDEPSPGGAGYAAAVLLPDQQSPRIISLGAAGPIDAAVEAWRDAVSKDPRPEGSLAGEVAYAFAARGLAERIWDPIVKQLEGAHRIFVVPDGTLQHVSFATLVTPDDKYFVEAGYAFHYLTTERDLVVPSAAADGKPTLLAIGDPAYGIPDSPQTHRFDPLPGSRREALEVASMWSHRGGTRLLTGDGATESAFKRLAPSFRVLHVATHGFFQSRVLAGESPLRVAGLAMAGANGAAASDDSRHFEDGILTAEEISLLDLHGVDWAVLSACATGDGTLEPGEGILGLRRAFQIAGARSLILSLWPVDDDATRAWMHALYESRGAGATTVAAVRDATRLALAEQRSAGGTTHPYFWGGFVSVGDWR